MSTAYHDLIIHPGISTSSRSGLSSAISRSGSSSVSAVGWGIKVINHLGIELIGRFGLPASVTTTPTTAATSTTTSRSCRGCSGGSRSRLGLRGGSLCGAFAEISSRGGSMGT